MTYEMHVAGLVRHLPICKLSDNLSIGAFVIFGDVELTCACARALLEKAPDFDYMVAPEAKAIPLHVWILILVAGLGTAYMIFWIRAQHYYRRRMAK